MNAVGTWIEITTSEIADLLDANGNASATLFERVAPSLLLAIRSSRTDDTTVSVQQRLEGIDDEAAREFVAATMTVAAVVLADPVDTAAILTSEWAVVAGQRAGWTTVVRIDGTETLLRVTSATLLEELAFHAESLTGVDAFSLTWSPEISMSLDYMFRDGALGGGTEKAGARFLGDFESSADALMSLVERLGDSLVEGATP